MSNTNWTQWVAFRNRCVYTNTYTHAAIIEKRSREFEAQQGDICGRVWGQDKDGKRLYLKCNIKDKQQAISSFLMVPFLVL